MAIPLKLSTGKPRTGRKVSRRFRLFPQPTTHGRAPFSEERSGKVFMTVLSVLLLLFIMFSE